MRNTTDSLVGRLRQEIESLKARKGELSRSVGEARRQGAPSEALIAELKEVSDKLKQANKQLKCHLNGADEAGGNIAIEDWDPFAGLAWPPSQLRAIKIQRFDDDDPLPPHWDDFVTAHPLASPYHLGATRQAVHATFGHRTKYLSAFDANDHILGILPLVQLKSRLFGNFVVSMPFFNYGGVLANNLETSEKLIQAAGQWADEIGAQHIELRHLKPIGMTLPRREDKVSFWLPLPDDVEQLWNSFKPKVRAQIRRPAELKPKTRFGGEELLDDFYQVFAHNMRDLGTPVYGKRFFRQMLNAQGGRGRLVVVYLDRKPVGCAFLLGFRERMEIPWASTVRVTNAVGINMLMYWTVLQYAVREGYKVFDFGRCSKDSGTYRFKRQWGAKPIPLVWEYRLASEQMLPQLNPDNPKFRFLIAVWQRLPVWLTKLLGPPIVKSLP